MSKEQANVIGSQCSVWWFDDDESTEKGKELLRKEPREQNLLKLSHWALCSCESDI